MLGGGPRAEEGLGLSASESVLRKWSFMPTPYGVGRPNPEPRVRWWQCGHGKPAHFSGPWTAVAPLGIT